MNRRSFFKNMLAGMVTSAAVMYQPKALTKATFDLVDNPIGYGADGVVSTRIKTNKRYLKARWTTEARDQFTVMHVDRNTMFDHDGNPVDQGKST
jgi:hypothetical protein